MRVGVVGTALCVLAGLCMVAALLVDLESTAAKVLIAVAAALFVPGALITYVWMRTKIPQQ